MLYLNLFWSFFKIGILGFGGGYAILPLIENIIVNTNMWLTSNEFIDLVTISQLTPGPILINSATFIGSKQGGVLGAICTTLGAVTPAFIIVICLSILYYKFKSLSIVKTMLRILKPAVVGLIAAAGVTILITVLFPNNIININNLDYIGLILSVISLLLIRYLKVNPIAVIGIIGIIGMVIFSII